MKDKAKITKKDTDEKKLFAFLATFLSIIGFIIALIVKPKDKYVIFYAKQSLVIFVMGCIAAIIQSLFIWIPIIGWIISFALTVTILLLWIFSWIYALSGKMQHLPVVEYWTRKIRL
jgi:uncharacterized membrane protein